MSRIKNLVGKRFGRLTVIELVGKDKNNRALWKCQCDCGNECVKNAKHLTPNFL